MAVNCDAPGLMPVENAIAIIIDTVNTLTDIEHCDLHKALNRVLAEDVVSPINVPAYNNSAMDGYAINASDLEQTTTLVQVGKSFAGNKFTGKLESGQCVRIMTGAEIPTGANTVVMQENTTSEGEHIHFHHPVKQGEAIRLAGSDIKKGGLVLAKGKRISPIDIGLLASLGLHKVVVFRQIKVAVFSTGDELLPIGEAARDDRIFDTNRPMILAMLSRLGAELIDMGIIPDQKELIRASFEKANELADCVITSGGVSVGEADYTREILEEYGQIDFWKLAIKPGKPLAFGRLPNSIFFGLPGNPVSSAVTFDQIAKLALKYMAGERASPAQVLKAKACSVFKKRPGRADYQRAHFYTNSNNELCVESTGTQSSGVLSCFSTSNCYAIIEQERGSVQVGETVSVLPFDHCIA
ncbi:gephyrin-like molybdotransferase Glp [Glaciecola sp. 2405UD65-10]|uniref:molybdopterin molybdotransferase MoeA n=1 Tax=Glaciecola sp. 2405UD65-10 TaxID=3397244 RepID=UPI003B5CF6C9